MCTAHSAQAAGAAQGIQAPPEKVNPGAQALQSVAVVQAKHAAIHGAQAPAAESKYIVG